MSVKFNGVELTNYLQVTEGFTPHDGANFLPVSNDRPQHTGADFVYTKVDAKTIDMPFIMQDNLGDKYDNLMAALNVKEPKELIFGAFPNRIFYAIPDGSLDFDEIFYQGEGTIRWHIPDGVGHSSHFTPVVFEPIGDGLLEATLVNNGSEWATVDYDITMNHDNGYIGVVSEHGIIQLGNIAEVDMEDALKSEWLTRNDKGDFANWTDATVMYENSGKGIVTTMSYDGFHGGRLGALPGNFTNTTNTPQFGACKEYVLTDTATDWYLWAQAWFEAGRMGQTGAWTLAMIDDQGRPIAGMCIEKVDKVGNTARVGFIVGNGNNTSRVVKWINFQSNYLVKENPYGTQGVDSGRNCFDLKKEGQKITFFWYGSYFSYNIPEVRDFKMKRVQFYVGQYHFQPVSKIVTRMTINNLILLKNNVPYMKDVPNRYPSDSTVHIDGDAKKPYYNNMIRLTDEIVGSNYFLIPPGETKVQIAYSDFSIPAPTVVAKINEVYL